MGHRTWEKLAVGTSAAFTFSVSPKAMVAFADLSGDHNPLHTDAKFARQYQFKNSVVFGALLIAQASRLLGMDLPGEGCIWHGLQMRFHAPLFVEETAEIKGVVTYSNPELRVLRIKIEIHRAADLIAAGEAQAGLLP